jgi:hypothetical protein
MTSRREETAINHKGLLEESRDWRLFIHRTVEKEIMLK